MIPPITHTRFATTKSLTAMTIRVGNGNCPSSISKISWKLGITFAIKMITTTTATTNTTIG